MAKQKRIKPRLYARETKSGVSFFYAARINGKKRWTKLHATTEAQAIAEWMEVEGQKKAWTFVELATRYEEEILPEKAIKTQRDYRRQLKSLVKAFGPFEVATLSPQDVYAYLDTRPKVSSNRERALLSTVLKKGIRWGYCETNICMHVERHRETPRNRYITDEELTTIIATSEEMIPVIALIVRLAYYTGARKGDLLKLKRSAIQDEGLFLEQHKTGHKMIFEWSPGLRRLVSELPRNNVWMFPTRTGSPYTEAGFDSVWRRIIIQTGIEDLHFHDLRAKAATDAKKEGMDYQSLLGHATQSMSDRYVKTREIARVKPIK